MTAVRPRGRSKAIEQEFALMILDTRGSGPQRYQFTVEGI